MEEVETEELAVFEMELCAHSFDETTVNVSVPREAATIVKHSRHGHQ